MNRRIALLTGLYVLLGGIGSLAGWMLDIQRLTDWNGNGISIQPNAALCVLFSGAAALALAVKRVRTTTICGAVVLSIGGLTLLEWLSGLSFGIDGLLMFGREWGRVGVLVPGRMGPPGSFCWTLIGASLVLSTCPPRFRRLAPALALTTAAVSGLSLIGYLFGAGQLYSLPYLTIIAFQTTTFIMAVSVGIIACHPEREPMRMLLDPGSAGMLARRALPLILLVPILVGFLRVKGQNAGLYDTGLGSALSTLIIVGFLAGVTGWVLYAVKAREEALHSARRAAEADARLLAEREHRIAGLLGSITDVFMSLDAEWRLTFINDQGIERLGKSREELVGRNLWEAFPDAVGTEAYAQLHRAMQGRVPVEYEVFYPPWQRWLFDRVFPTPDGGLAVYSLDVTDRKTAEQGLREAMAEVQVLHRLAMDLAKLGEPQEFYERLMDAAVEIMHADFASFQVLHPGRDSAQGELELQAWRGFTPEAAEFWKRVRADSQSACGVALSTGQRCDVADILHDSRISGADLASYEQAGIRAVQTTPLFSRDGRLLGAISTHWKTPRAPQTVTDRDWRMLDVLAQHASDLLQRVQSDAAVRRNAATFAALVEQSPLGIYTVDSQFRVRNVSRGAMEAFRNVKPLIGRDFAEVMRIIWAEPFATKAIGIFRHTLQSGEPYVSPGMTEVRQDIGSAESYEWQTIRVTLDDGQYGVVCYYFETTRLQQAQQSLRDADRRKDEFLATLAHELRNPLAPVRNAVQLLHLKGPDVPELLWARDVIDRQIQQMTRLVDDLMDVSRISRGKIELRRERILLTTVIQGAVETSRPLIEQCGHELTVTLPPETLCLDADLTRLAQVFANLLNNAAKYTERGGAVYLTAERQGSDIVVSVKDSGIGIPRDKLRTVFELFSQVDGALERSQGGLGIGLSLVKGLVEMHGGTVEARSEGPGRGSEFVVRLPLVVEQQSAATPPKSDAETALASSLRILIVDDNRDAADSLGRMFRVMGNEVRTAYDGEAAVRAAGDFRPQAVVLDIGLPKLNGYEACRRIREETWGQSMVLIAVTGWGQDEDKRKAEEAGFDRHFVKPVDPRELIKLLGSLIEVHAS